MSGQLALVFRSLSRHSQLTRHSFPSPIWHWNGTALGRRRLLSISCHTLQQQRKERQQKTDVPPSTSRVNLSQYLESNFPTVHKYWRLTVDGSKWCWNDMKTYWRISQALRKGERKLTDLTIQELLIYIQTVDELLKLLPLVVVACIIPGGLPLVVVAVIVSPRLVLTRHFWTQHQTQLYQIDEFRKNARYRFPAVIDALKRQSRDPSQFDKLPLQIEHISKIDLPLLDNSPLFHLLMLKRLHRVTLLVPNSSSLVRQVTLMQNLDAKMAVDRSLVRQLDDSHLRLHLYLRKLNYELMDTNEMRNLLNWWLDHSKTFRTPAQYVYAPILTQADPREFISGGQSQLPKFEEANEKLRQFTNFAAKKLKEFKRNLKKR